MRPRPSFNEDHDAVLKLKQRKRNELMDNSFELNREIFKPFLPEGVDKVRLIPGPEAQRLQSMATFVYGAEEYNREFAEDWLRKHKWRRVYITDENREWTKDPMLVPRDKLELVHADGEGFLYFFLDDRGRPANPPDYLHFDLSGIKLYITSMLGIMTGTKNEELIANTLENRDPESPPFHVPRPLPEVEPE